MRCSGGAHNQIRVDEQCIESVPFGRRNIVFFRDLLSSLGRAIDNGNLGCASTFQVLERFHAHFAAAYHNDLFVIESLKKLRCDFAYRDTWHAYASAMDFRLVRDAFCNLIGMLKCSVHGRTRKTASRSETVGLMNLGCNLRFAHDDGIDAAGD